MATTSNACNDKDGRLGSRWFVAAGAGLAVLGLAGCSPREVGVTAVSEADGRLLVAVMRCDSTSLDEVRVVTPTPNKVNDEDGEPVKGWTRVGRWRTDDFDSDIVILDTGRPSPEWSTKIPLTDLKEDTPYYMAFGTGNSDVTVREAIFRASDLERLPQGHWLYTVQSDFENAEMPYTNKSTDDLKDLRKKSCRDLDR